MRMRVKAEYTYQQAVSEEERLTREIADLVIKNSYALNAIQNTISIQQNIGALKMLRSIIIK